MGSLGHCESVDVIPTRPPSREINGPDSSQPALVKHTSVDWGRVRVQEVDAPAATCGEREPAAVWPPTQVRGGEVEPSRARVDGPSCWTVSVDLMLFRF